jgi:hypothetical protein
MLWNLWDQLALRVSVCPLLCSGFLYGSGHVRIKYAITSSQNFLFFLSFANLICFHVFVPTISFLFLLSNSFPFVRTPTRTLMLIILRSLLSTWIFVPRINEQALTTFIYYHLSWPSLFYTTYTLHVLSCSKISLWQPVYLTGEMNRTSLELSACQLLSWKAIVLWFDKPFTPVC